MLSQLHSILSNHTLIERELSALIASGVVRKLLLRGSSADGRGGEVTGMGGEIGLVLQETYSSLISHHSLELPAFAKWHEDGGHLVVSIPHSNLIAQGITADEIKKAVELGFLTIEYSLREAGYTISVPGSGNFIRNLRGGRRELLRYLKRQRYKESLEKVPSDSFLLPSHLLLHISFSVYVCLLKNLIAKKSRESLLSYGFHLHELVGSGRVEVFMSPAGRGVKITSKGLAEVN